MSLRFSIECDPGELAINRAYAARAFYDKDSDRWKGQLYGNGKWKTAKKGLVRKLKRAHRGQPCMTGPLRVEIATFWPQQNRKLGIPNIAKGDVDAPAKAILDCLEKAKVIVKDAQVVEYELRKEPAFDSPPRIEIVVCKPRVEDPQTELF